MMREPTLMERHAALGPILWADGGMIAGTSDGYSAEILPADVGLPWLVKLYEPQGKDGAATCWGAKCADLRAARVLIAEEIGRFRDAERGREEAVAQARTWVLDVALHVMTTAERGLFEP